MVAGAAYQIVESCTFASEHNYSIGPKIVAVVIRCATLVQTDAPDIAFFEGFEGTDQVDDAGEAEMLGGAGRGLDGDGAEGGGTALGEEDAVDSGSFGGAEDGSEVLRIFNAVEGQDEAGFRAFEKVFGGEEFSLTNDGHDTLVAGGSGYACEGIAGLSAERDFGGAAEFDDGLEPLVVSFLRNAYVVEAAGTGSERFFDRVEAVDNFHLLKSNVAEGRKRTDNGGVTSR
jgi:hypothetical protein